MHTTSTCPSQAKEVDVAAMNFQRPNQFNQTNFNSGWKDNYNSKWGGNDNRGYQGKEHFYRGAGSSQSQFGNPSMNSFQTPSTSREVPIQEPNKNNTLINLMSKLCDKIEQMEVKHNNLTTFVSQLANSRSKDDAKKGDLPSNTVMNPKGLNAISLRSGRKVGFEAEKDEEATRNHVEEDTDDDIEVVYDESIGYQTKGTAGLHSKHQIEKTMLKESSILAGNNEEYIEE